MPIRRGHKQRVSATVQGRTSVLINFTSFALLPRNSIDPSTLETTPALYTGVLGSVEEMTDSAQ